VLQMPMQISDCLWFSFLNQAPVFFEETERQSKWLVNDGKPQHVANTAWSFATLGYQAPTLFDEIDRNIDHYLELFNIQNICNACYAIAVMGVAREYKATLKKLWVQSLSAGNNLENEGLRQLAQALLFATAEGVQLSQILESMWIQQQKAVERTSNTVSRSSTEISQLLIEIGFDHATEVAPDKTISGGMLAIDFASTERMVAIEYDGTPHYLKALGSGELTRTENGPTKAKRRFLEQLGWTVVNLDFRNYTRAKVKSKEREWLSEELRQAGVELFSE